MNLNEQEIKNKGDLKEDVWAYGFSVANSKKGTKETHLKPTRGVIENYSGLLFIPYSQKTGKLMERQTRYIHYLGPICICNDEATAIGGYNTLVNKRIIELEEQIAKLKLLLI